MNVTEASPEPKASQLVCARYDQTPDTIKIVGEAHA